MLLISLLIFICLGIICYQDMRYRAVSWVCFPLLAITMFAIKQQEAGWRETLIHCAGGLSFFGIQLFFLWFYISLKHRRFINITSDCLGLGDILFLMAIAFYFSPVNYILFYTGSLIVVLIYTLVRRHFLKEPHYEIPLAGLQALLLSMLIMLSLANPNLKPYTDSWIYGL